MSGETVFVTDGQLRSALAVARSLGRRDVNVVCGETTRFATTFYSRYVDDTVVYPSPESDPDAFVAFLEEFVRSRRIDAVLPVGHETTRLVSKHRDELLAHTHLPVTDYERFMRGWDKAKTFRAAERAGIPTPRTVCPSSASDAADVADDIGYPVVIKSRSGSGSRGLEFVRSPDSFHDAYRKVHSTHPNPLVQERIPQEGAMYGAAFVYDEDSDVRAQFACEFMREYPPSGGPSTLHRTVAREDILEYGRQLLDELDWQGVALVEFKLDTRDDTPKLMEVNPRFWSSLHLTLFAGVDFPWLVLQHALGNEVPEAMEYRVGVRGRYMLPGDLIRLASVRNATALREFFPLFDDETTYEILSADDKGPTIGRLLAMGRFAASPSMWQKAILRN